MWQVPVRTPTKRKAEPEPLSCSTPPKCVEGIPRRVRGKQVHVVDGPTVLTNVQKHQILSQSPGPGNRFCQNFDRKATENCLVCRARKHHVKWGEARRTIRQDRSVVRGTQCYACVVAALKLQAGRSFESYSKVDGALDVWRRKSAAIRTHLRSYGGDVCFCSDCTET